jgi:hypothetical protein
LRGSTGWSAWRAFLEGMLTSLEPALDQHCLPFLSVGGLARRRTAAGLYWSWLRVHEPLRESYTHLP